MWLQLADKRETNGSEMLPISLHPDSVLYVNLVIF